MAGRVSQTLPQRYIERADLKNLLQSLFGQDFETEVSTLSRRPQARRHHIHATSSLIPMRQ